MNEAKTIETSVQKLIREFEERSFVTIPGALSADEVCRLNRAIDEDLLRFSGAWVRFDETLNETVDILSRTAEFDFTIENPRTLDFLRALLGKDITLEEFEAMIREPSAKPQDIKGWHRDMIRDYDRRMEIGYISVIYYLTDVTERDHCFSIIPGTHGPRVDLRPEDVTPGSEFDLLGPAGTAVIFHGRAIHCGKLKPDSRERRTLHLYYWTDDQPRASEWTEIPERLWRRKDPLMPPKLYAKWNRKDVADGVGKKPADLDPSMPVSEMLRAVMLRASKKK